jgi:uncharacterized protein YkwD
MKRILLLILIGIVAYFSKPVWEDSVKGLLDKPIIHSIVSKAESLKNSPEARSTFDQINGMIEQIDDSINQLNNDKAQTTFSKVDKPTLSAPTDHHFSVHNIELGDAKTKVEQEAGAPKRHMENEYGVDWYTYHDHYQNFMMVSYDSNGKVNGLYTNQDLISSSLGVKLNSSKASVQKSLGEPLTKIRKGLLYYQIQDNGEYNVYQMDNSYVTVFYDKHENNTVTAIQIIGNQLEANRKEFYSEPSANLKEGFEYQLFDLTNAARVNHNLGILTFDDHVQNTARKHSLDMAQNHYFDHTNLKGQSPFDRMQEDGITFHVAGENLAYGQFSSVFAHEGLMNSLGHRENILQKDYRMLGVGVAFNEKSQPYYTENFYAN